ncbi:ATP-dependent RNA helicase DDX51 [Chanos chanos]|uniref:ATP-dependent RNA helicase n=1 Tax=Chanos chanos TaxID=29144 RepID=A0A6J2URD0_CHACN|nr:ATP-dependent RNA helicase DDX51 [Chanos chanos]
MALFLINRYLGDEEENEAANESRSKALLAKLQQRAKAREQQGLSGKGEREDRNPVPRDSDTVSEKKKNSALSESTSKKKKVKKKAKENKNEKADIDEHASREEEGAADGKVEETKSKNDSGDERKRETDVQSEPSTQDQGQKPSEPGFHILGGFEKKTVQKVQRVLPQWLAQPDVIQKDIRNNLVPVREVPGICPRLLQKLEDNGIHSFFPVQAEVIPAVLESVSCGLLVGRGGYRPRDVCVSAPTGSGKTLAFVLPVIQALSKRVICEVRALAVLPTKELAQQVYKVFCSYAEGTNLKVVMVSGQKTFAAEQAALSEKRGGVRRSLADIVVATPGRLVDHINKNDGFSLKHLRFLIIDEADRMIDSMHQSWLSQVTKAVYRGGSGSEMSIFGRTEPGPITAASLSIPQMPLQKLLFSATLTQNPEKLQQLDLHQPRLFSSVHTSGTTDSTHTEEKFHLPQGLTEYYVPCTLSKKPLLLLHFLLRSKFSPVLCFTNSREAAHRLYLLVKLFGGVEVAEFSSRLSAGERKKTLKSFEQGKIQLLISTDAAARGIDVNGVKYVVNYDAPQYIRTYVHRVGRTARAGKAGLAFTFLLGVQERKFLQMVRDAGSPGINKQIVKPESLRSMEERYEETLQELGKIIKEEKASQRI